MILTLIAIAILCIAMFIVAYYMDKTAPKEPKPPELTFVEGLQFENPELLVCQLKEMQRKKGKEE